MFLNKIVCNSVSNRNIQLPSTVVRVLILAFVSVVHGCDTKMNVCVCELVSKWVSMCGEIGDNDGMIMLVVDCVYIVSVNVISKGL